MLIHLQGTSNRESVASLVNTHWRSESYLSLHRSIDKSLVAIQTSRRFTSTLVGDVKGATIMEWPSEGLQNEKFLPVPLCTSMMTIENTFSKTRGTRVFPLWTLTSYLQMNSYVPLSLHSETRDNPHDNHITKMLPHGGSITVDENGDYRFMYSPPGIKSLLQNRYALSAALFASLGGLTFGYDQVLFIPALEVDHCFDTYILYRAWCRMYASNLLGRNMTPIIA